MARVQLDRGAVRNPPLAVLSAKWSSLDCISTCSALLRCVLRGLGGRGKPLCGRRATLSDLFPVASQLRMHHASLLATVLCADLQARYAPFVPELSVYLPPSP